MDGLKVGTSSALLNNNYNIEVDNAFSTLDELSESEEVSSFVGKKKKIQKLKRIEFKWYLQ